MQLWAMIETCAVVPHLDALAALSAGTRLSLFVMGVNDLAKEMRLTPTPSRLALLHALSTVLLAGREWSAYMRLMRLDHLRVQPCSQTWIEV